MDFTISSSDSQLQENTSGSDSSNSMMDRDGNNPMDRDDNMVDGPNAVHDGPIAVEDGLNAVEDGLNPVEDGPNAVEDANAIENVNNRPDMHVEENEYLSSDEEVNYILYLPDRICTFILFNFRLFWK